MAITGTTTDPSGTAEHLDAGNGVRMLK